MAGIVSKNAFRLRNKKISATAPTDKQVLRYDAATDQYVPDSLSDLAPSVHTHSASDITSGVFGVNRGGTGLSAIASGKLLYASADNVLSELSLGSTLAISSGVLNVQNNTSTQKVEVAKTDVLIGTRKRINFVEGSNITLTINDDNVNDKVDITIAASGGSTTHNLLSATHPDTVVASPVLGDIIYANSTPAWTKLAGNTTTTKKFLTQTGTGTESAAPAWDTIAATDLPSHTHSAADITSGTLAVARGGTGQDFSAASQGSIIYFSATGTMATLPPGTAGQFLKTQGAGANPVWANVPSGGWILKTYQASTSQTVSITGLDLDADLEYKIIVSFHSTSDSGYPIGHLEWKYNNVSTVYYRFLYHGTGDIDGNYSIAPTERNFATLSSASYMPLSPMTSPCHFFEITLRKRENINMKPRFTFRGDSMHTFGPSTSYGIYSIVGSGVFDDNVNITSLQFNSTASSRWNWQIWIFKPATS
jgi:hypothetical protein